MAFLHAALLSELPPGRGLHVDVGGEAVALFHVAGEVFAVEDVCPHAQAPLSGGFIEQSCFVVCPWHAWRFDLRSGGCERFADVQLRRYAVQVVEGAVRVDPEHPL